MAVYAIRKPNAKSSDWLEFNFQLCRMRWIEVAAKRGSAKLATYE